MHREATDNDGRRRHFVIDRRGFLRRTGAIAAAGLGATALANAQDWEPSPDPAHLLRRGRGWKVLPTGHDDHDNLEWALRNTATGGTVRLVPGTYKIGSPILVPDFDGRLVGAGAARTTITCTDEFSYELWEAPGGGKDRNEPPPPPFPRRPVEGSTTRSAPALISFYKTPLQPGERPERRANRIEIRDIRCRGAMKGELWAFGDEVLCINIVNSVDWHHPESAPATTRQDVLISGLEVDGYSTPSFGPFENACACVTILGGPILTSNYDLGGDVNGDALGLETADCSASRPRKATSRSDRARSGTAASDPASSVTRTASCSSRISRPTAAAATACRLSTSASRGVSVRGGDLRCDSFILPPELVGADHYPSTVSAASSRCKAPSRPSVPRRTSAGIRWRTIRVHTRRTRKPGRWARGDPAGPPRRRDAASTRSPTTSASRR